MSGKKSKPKFSNPLKNKPSMILMTLLITLCVLAFYLFEWYSSKELFSDKPVVNSLMSKIEDLNGMVLSLKQENEQFQHEHIVLSQVNTTLREENQTLQDQTFELEKDLQMLRQIVAPEQNRKGLYLAGFLLKPQDDSPLYHFRLILAQSAQERNWLQGTVEIKVHGKDAAGQNIILPWKAFSKEDAPSFRFRYLQTLEGSLLLPQGISPDFVEVSVQQSDKEPVVSTYPWPAS